MIKRLFPLLLLQLVAILIFSAGFFPQKSVLTGDAEFRYHPEEHLVVNPKFEKLVVVVIDALRSDYLFHGPMSHFNFAHELLNKGHAWGYTAYSNPPTVTLPRLKGITTGSTPNFLDAILNVAGDDSSSTLKDQDSWLRQFHINQKTIKFFGDDTWLKLFPEEFFSEIDGTNSFFVSDFEEVDLNVTRHLPAQLASQQSWDVMILHYLGLDHIGHKGGAYSKFMPPKHREMDSVIKQIYDSVEDNTLVCVMGDHGMNDMGNHGGSSAGETSAGMMLMSKMLGNYEKPVSQQLEKLPIETKNEDYKYLTKINQIDIVPTIAALFNFPIPKNSIGVIIPDALRLFSPQEAHLKLMDNYYQLASISGDEPMEALTDNVMVEKMTSIQSELAKTATNYNYTLLGIGFLLLLVTSLAVSIVCYRSTNLCFALLPLFMVSSLLSLSTFGSSFVEEEHQLWWWISIALLGASYVKALQDINSHLTVLICLRFIRGWNNSGQKYVYEHTMLELLKEHFHWQWALNAITIFATQIHGRRGSTFSNVAGILISGICIFYKAAWSIVNGEQIPFWLQITCLKIAKVFPSTGDSLGDLKGMLVPMARLFFWCATGLAVFDVLLHRFSRNDKRFLDRIHATATTILIFQSSSANIPLFLVFQILSSQLESLWHRYHGSNVFLLMTVGLALQHLTFFQFGSTNSIATVNLTNAYNGVSENYNIYVVGLLMCVGNFAPSIYWSLSCLKMIYSKQHDSKWGTFNKSRLPSLLFYCVFGCFLFGSCVVQRYHLFIWSVFSPKLCYYVSWNLFMNTLIAWLIEGVLVLLL
ncbi:LANO_0H01992g1_1 [Lachancea nothofagi CBS 11611]|uniref:GPI ethanolamine phosphate transferase 2 n=1 Tax=Lachancea nothofagi CBS 11611 TaxID=1266666 RepID=A0A1G4KL17_9SACH|nr:LANO_0H01992g1_1 [Lachancea nothofagi CBS 11611]